MAHIFECSIFQHNIFQGDCGGVTPAPPRPGGGNLSLPGLEGFIRRRHKLRCEWEALKAAQDAARKLRAQKYWKKREALQAANQIAAKALHDAELCDLERSMELAQLEQALSAAAHAKKSADILGYAMQIENKANALKQYLLDVEEQIEEEESIVGLFI